MVKIDSGERKKSPMTMRLFLNSIKKWHNKDGVPLVVESVGKLVESDKEGEVSIPVEFGIEGDMPKCFARVIDDKGEVVKIEDEFGEEKDKIETISNPENVTGWFKMRIEDPENDEFKVFNLGSFFPLLNYAFIQSGDLPENNKKNIIFTYDELLDALEGLEFRCKTETRKFKGGKPYQVIIPSDL